MYTLDGVSSVANFITVYEESQYNRDSHFLSVVCSLLPKAIRFYFYFNIHNHQHFCPPKW